MDLGNSGGGKGKKVTIICAYRVGKKTLSSAGMSTIWTQEYQEYMKLNLKQINPQQQILDDLGDFITYKRQNGHSIILLIDANESYWKISSPLVNMCSQTRLVNSYNYLHPNLQEVPTHSSGSTQIDYIFVTEDLLPALRRGGILPLCYLHPAYHRALYLDIDVELALESPIEDLINPYRHNFSTANIKELETYHKELKRMYQEHNIEDRVAVITAGFAKSKERSKWIEKAQKIAAEMDQYVEATAGISSSTPFTTTYSWSEKFAKAGQKITYWKRRTNSAESTQSIPPYNNLLKDKLKIKDTLSLSVDYINNALDKAWKQKRKLHKCHNELCEEHLQA